MICRCGYQNEPDDFYCAQCGRKLSRKKGPKGWIIAIIIVVLLAAAGAAAWFLIPREAPEEDEPEQTQQEEPQDPQAVRPEDVKEPEEELPPDQGWDSSRTCYYEDGKPLTGLQEIEGEYYYFLEETGEKQTGWVEIEGNWYYFTEEGPAPGAGWYSDDKGWFYLEEDGRHHRESPFPDEENGREYILDDQGYLTRMEYYELTCIEVNEEIEGSMKPALMIPGTLTNCRSLTFRCSEGGVINYVDAPVWEIWVGIQGEWVRIADAPVKQEDGSYILSFAQPQTFDTICIHASGALRVHSTLTDVTVVF